MVPDLKRPRRKIGHKYYTSEKKRKYGILDARRTETNKLPLRTQNHKQTVSDLVYQYLGNLAEVNYRRKQRRNARSIFHRNHIRKQPGDLHPNRHMMDITPEPILDSKMKYNIPTYLPLTYKTSFSQFPRSSVCNREIVKDYAKAVDDGRNIARKYVCKALSFGVHSGFLVPADNKGQILRVSSNLCLFQTRANMKKNKTFKKNWYVPACLTNIKRRKLTNGKVKKRFLKSPRTTRLRQIKKKSKYRKTRK